ncbi:MAG: glycosyltransferase [Berryella intestinalis]|uniref:glycosyltransferase n=1 Tax=Berryella intestinalis TaxID=1531429 RepID=UPI002A587B0C|nr:glycosyltransferase [Berryella intestinalis]MDD7368797.1 glycosyltransferase [Berryella intestinalis]MDY3128902.1 glycosyltransferase [Berryella intestinalis]
MTNLDSATAPAESAASLPEKGPTTAADASRCEKPLVMVVHASVGSGHKSAAKSVAQALELLRDEGFGLAPADLEVEVVDILDWGRHKFDGDRAASYFVGATRPIYDLAWRYTFTGRLLWGGGTIWSHIMYAPFTRYIAERRPWAVVATHITAANSAVAARMLTRQDFPVISVPTDYETEGLWPHKSSDLFCVATQSMAETLRARKVEDDRIRITGIPTREDFRKPYDREETRRKLGLPLDKTVVLILAGAQLPTPYLRFREALDKTLPYLHTLSDLHLVFIAGSDAEYEKHLRAMKRDYELDNMTVFGYVDGMAALMNASNLVVCKSGGLTVTECLCAEVPMILVGRAYGQEKINVEMLTSASAAMHVTTPRELIDALRYIMRNPHGIDAMLVNARFIRRPDAARDVAAEALKLARVSRDASDPLRRKRFARFYIGHQPAHVR